MDRDVVFLSSPSLGILDNWLPILAEISERNTSGRLRLVLPRPKSIEELRWDSVLVRISDSIFDSVIWRSRNETWIETGSIRDAFAQRRAGTALTRILGRRVSAIQGKILGRRDILKYGFFPGPVDLLYDVVEEGLPFASDVALRIPISRSFSLCHGINVNEGGRDVRRLPNFKSRLSKLQPVTFLFSEMERGYYKSSFGIPDERIRVVGVPRHDPAWVSRIQNEESFIVDDLPPNFIGLISRPYNSKYLPTDRKLKALNALKSVAQDMNLPIVLKKHPKLKDSDRQQELDDEIYKSVFKKSEFGRVWFETTAHWFALAPRCVFSMSFFSGVVVDMAALGVPTVEWLDLRGLPKADNAAAMREPDGTPVYSYRYLGLVAGATTEACLREFAEKAATQREEVAAPFVNRYHEIFGDPRHAIDRVMREFSISEIGLHAH